jgi:hypothetical protein
MARPRNSPPPESDAPRDSPAELRAELRIAIAQRERAVAQRDFYQRSLETLSAECEKTRGALAALQATTTEAQACDKTRPTESAELNMQRNAEPTVPEQPQKTGSKTCKPDPPGARRRMGWRKRVLLSSASVLVLLAGFGLAVTRRPAWYHPAPIDRERLRADKAGLVGLEDEISAAVNRGQEIRFRLDEAQINRWLAARAEMWPEWLIDLGSFQDPQVSLGEGEIRIGATAIKGGLRTVVTLTCRVDVQADRVTVEHGGLRLGAIPVPNALISDLVRQVSANSEGTIQADKPGTVALENDWVWPNGKRRCRLRELNVSNGIAEVVLEPLAAGRR